MVPYQAFALLNSHISSILTYTTTLAIKSIMLFKGLITKALIKGFSPCIAAWSSASRLSLLICMANALNAVRCVTP